MSQLDVLMFHINNFFAGKKVIKIFPGKKGGIFEYFIKFIDLRVINLFGEDKLFKLVIIATVWTLKQIVKVFAKEDENGFGRGCRGEAVEIEDRYDESSVLLCQSHEEIGHLWKATNCDFQTCFAHLFIRIDQKLLLLRLFFLGQFEFYSKFDWRRGVWWV